MASSEQEKLPTIVRNLSDEFVQEIAVSIVTPSSSQPVTPRTAYQRSHLPNSVTNFNPGNFSAAQSGYFTGDALEQSSIAEANKPGTDVSSNFPSVFTRDSFMSPPVRPATIYQSIHAAKPPQKSVKPSTMLTGEVVKPWKSKNNSRMRVAYWITYAAAALGIVAGFLRCFFGWRDVPRLGNLCQVMEEEFEALNMDIWSYDIDLGGFGCVIGSYSLGIPSSIRQIDRSWLSGTTNLRWQLIRRPTLSSRTESYTFSQPSLLILSAETLFSMVIHTTSPGAQISTGKPVASSAIPPSEPLSIRSRVLG